MGSCVSVHKHSDSALKLRLGFGSKTDKLVTPSPPVKHKPMLADHLLKPLSSPPRPLVTASRDFGSKEETFFDSHAWLESDCEDDFFSVNGDFTPSRGTTPVHYSFSGGNPRSNRHPFAENSTPVQSTSDKKKKLSELFKDTGGDQDENQSAAGKYNGAARQSDSKTSVLEAPQKPGNDMPHVSGANSTGSSERSPTGDVRLPREKLRKSAECCLPRLRSLSERKKRTSPARSLG
ncbi:uncharacterized protein At3g27210 [Coffea eugenioides]|uniref:uncharacterized protein At3g27210 n=1 Tax=Coffea eugenioides TaxID=49369 RepID=UPI000F60679C|nr:uncharacterized protein At3g27210 [Coffea eugenioides]